MMNMLYNKNWEISSKLNNLQWIYRLIFFVITGPLIRGTKFWKTKFCSEKRTFRMVKRKRILRRKRSNRSQRRCIHSYSSLVGDFHDRAIIRVALAYFRLLNMTITIPRAFPPYNAGRTHQARWVLTDPRGCLCFSSQCIYTSRGRGLVSEKRANMCSRQLVLTTEEEEATSDECPMIRAAMTDQGGYCSSEDQRHRCHLERRWYPEKAEEKSRISCWCMLRLKTIASGSLGDIHVYENEQGIDFLSV